jgi:hypothetical protein
VPSLDRDLPPETHQFDFWLGDWDLTWADGGAGSNNITRILNGHVIQERFSASPTSPNDTPLHGLSLSMFDPAIGQWRQTWVDNCGNYLTFAGASAEGRLTLSTERTADGATTTYRMVFYNISSHSLDWDWERSADRGQSWELLWRIHYQRRT